MKTAFGLPLLFTLVACGSEPAPVDAAASEANAARCLTRLVAAVENNDAAELKSLASDISNRGSEYRMNEEHRAAMREAVSSMHAEAVKGEAELESAVRNAEAGESKLAEFREYRQAIETLLSALD